MGYEDVEWIHVSQNRDQWWAFLNMTFGLYKKLECSAAKIKPLNTMRSNGEFHYESH
jgi:hypothetical protein